MDNKLDRLISQSRRLREESKEVLRLNGISYDLSEWLTIKEYAVKYGLSGTNVVSNWIERGIIQKDDYIEVSKLNSLKLVKDKVYK